MGPWRATAAAISGEASHRGRVFPSGRQALTQALRSLGLGRGDRVAVPEWSSHCVLSAVGAVATPVPMREARDPAAVLVYDQWGWPCSYAGIRAKWPAARIVHDCVDTASLDFSDADAQVWSLSKVLGLKGGGLARVGEALLEFEPAEADQELCSQLERLGQHDLAKTHARWLLDEVQHAAGADLERAYAEERRRRVANLQAKGGDLPGWMDGSSGPGLYPLRTDKLDETRAILLRHGIDAPIYNFDFVGDAVSPRYERCVALPLHGEVSVEILATL